MSKQSEHKNDQPKTLTGNEAISKLRDLIKEIDFCMLTTVDEDGTLRSRPMSTQDAEFDGDLWFLTSDASGKAGEIQREHQVNLSYADIGKQTYVSVSGVGTIVHDRAKIEEYWNPFYNAYFPEGKDSPDLALLKVHVNKAEYWESDGKIASILQMAKALITGGETDLGENAKIKL
jgi:general stress protein 26